MGFRFRWFPLLRLGTLGVVALGVALGPAPAHAWKACSEEEGGGTCPEGTTCCPVAESEPGRVGSACIPLFHSDHPGPGGEPGRCCKGGDSGCRFGYECAFARGNYNDTGNDNDTDTPAVANVSKRSLLRTTLTATTGEGLDRNSNSNSDRNSNNDSNRNNDSNGTPYCKATNETLLLDPSARDTPRYGLCRIPPELTKEYEFPVTVSPGETKNEASAEKFHLAYYSNLGSIVASTDGSHHGGREPSGGFEGAGRVSSQNVEQILLLVHGSLRDADDYFCAGLSLAQGENATTVGVLAPRFASVRDDAKASASTSASSSSSSNSSHRALVWEDGAEAYGTVLWHTWRYGADAANAPVSSFKVLDQMVGHLSASRDRFPRLRQITVAGHSAGGQLVQRWALLSDSPAWKATSLRAVVANPRSYAYLDGRRWFGASGRIGPGGTEGSSSNSSSNSNITSSSSNAVRGNARDGSRVFRRPVPGDGVDRHCPWYNDWLWGLGSSSSNNGTSTTSTSGELPCPYRDRAMAGAGSASALAQRYAGRRVIYLSGERDTEPHPGDRCGSVLQGRNRHERAVLFYDGLQEYFSGEPPLAHAHAHAHAHSPTEPRQPVHEFHTIPMSDHDHSFMFQSRLGRAAIFGY